MSSSFRLYNSKPHRHRTKCSFFPVFYNIPPNSFFTHCRPGSTRLVTTWMFISKNNFNSLFCRKQPLYVHCQKRSPLKELQRKINISFGRKSDHLRSRSMLNPRIHRHKLHIHIQQGQIKNMTWASANTSIFLEDNLMQI